ncbi:MAG: hypothetical protein AO394_07135 [Candidatus Fermentibacter daniensis]|nr:MAG: hypothetical protein AO394_07135 [Candidatus Fermentibacter daniensis]
MSPPADSTLEMYSVSSKKLISWGALGRAEKSSGVSDRPSTIMSGALCTITSPPGPKSRLVAPEARQRLSSYHIRAASSLEAILELSSSSSIVTPVMVALCPS